MSAGREVMEERRGVVEPLERRRDIDWVDQMPIDAEKGDRDSGAWLDEEGGALPELGTGGVARQDLGGSGRRFGDG